MALWNKYVSNDKGIVCEKCGQPMVKREGRFGPFLGCSGYPKCKNIKKLTNVQIEETERKNLKKVTSQREVKSECKPLIAAATKDIYRQNAFRITGLPVDANAREISKHAERLKVMEELGEGASAHCGAFSLDPPPAVDQIREAIHTFNDPERRLIDEFFWFWPRKFGESASDPALLALAKGDLQTAYDIWGTYEDDPTDGVIATHNKALTTQIIALDQEESRISGSFSEQNADEIENNWRRSFKRWERLVVDERLWDRVTVRAQQICH